MVLFIFACSPKPNIVEPAQSDYAEVDGDIYVVSHGWHTGLVIPAGLIQSRIPELKGRFKNVPYIEFGWGDKGFYQSNEITTELIVKAMFWPTESVLHVVAVYDKAPKYFPDSQVEKVCLNGNGYASLIRFIENSFFKNEQGEIIKLNRGIYGDSQFYKSVGDFYSMNTCNKWTAKALKSAGMNITPAFKLTAGSIMDYIVENSQVLEQGNCPSL